MSFPWDTLFVHTRIPAGWTFAIWGIIFIGEFAGVVAPLIGVGDGVKPDGFEVARARGWVAANVAQCLWCAAFRPWCLGLLWLPSILLATTALCLVASEVSGRGESSTAPLTLVSVPRGLHLGLVTAACLVNINAFVGTPAAGSLSSPDSALSIAKVSIAAAQILGAIYGLVLGLPAASFAVAWGVLGVATGMPTSDAAAAVGILALERISSAAKYAGIIVAAISAASFYNSWNDMGAQAKGEVAAAETIKKED
mmetsp:Transcript_16174/g.33068  ORF Transcript_16174/g.33068 Transcript_16174/m.33068 type:complete len:254 (+) Transcript_16174:3-764(+)